jgi:hypothetical protein
MPHLAIRTICAACVAALLATAPAAADPATSGGLEAGAPLTLSPAGGLNGPRAAPEARSAQMSQEPTTTAPASPSTTATTPDEGGTTAQVPVTEPAERPASPATIPASSRGGGGGGLPHTGFAVAALLAVGTGFFLTGYALRYSRTLDG